MKIIIFWICIALIGLSYSCKNVSRYDAVSYSGWENYAGSKDGIRYSSQQQINVHNVSNLKVAWRFSSHDKDTANRSQIQCNPVIIDGTLYGISARLKLFALDAFTGKLKWMFDPATEDTASAKDPEAFFKVSRGVAYWRNRKGANSRILFNAGSRTYAINANNGRLIRSFGNNGYIDLTRDLDSVKDSVGLYIAATTPGIIYNDLLIIGMRVAESDDAAPGHIRAYNVITGKRQWIFHTIPHPGEFGYDSWPDKNAWKYTGGANSWAGFSLDEKRGIVYVPTGSIAGDFYGGNRKGTNLFANSLIALEASTGKYIWHYQIVHHDLWDRDLPANPNLVTLKRKGINTDVVAQITKHGYIFIFDRVTGKPFFDIIERPVPHQALPGEEPWPTQPIPQLPEPFARQKFNLEDVTVLSMEAHEEMREKFKQIKYKTMFTPPSKEGSWIFPGFDGGGEWGGASVDPESGIMYVNSTELPWSLTMIDIPEKTKDDNSFKGIGIAVYNKNCISCHGVEMKGNGPTYPSLENLDKKYTAMQLKGIIENGKNMMPSFKQIPTRDKNALIAYILGQAEKEPFHPTRQDVSAKKADAMEQIAEPGRKQSPYVMTGYNRFLDKDGYPGIKPPWGTLNAINLNTGKLLWKVPLGEYPELSEKSIPITGTENYGGPINTKGGLVFIAATRDAKIRAFNKENGKVLWEADLPVPGYATPSTYFINGKQYLVIACGGGKIGSKSGDEYIAFSLP